MWRAFIQRPAIRRVVTSRPAAGVVEMTVVLGFGPRSRALAIRLEHLPEPMVHPIAVRAKGMASERPPAPLRVRVPADAVPDAEGLRMVLAEFGGNVAHVASYFGKDRKQIYRWAERLGVKIEGSRPAGSDAGGRD